MKDQELNALKDAAVSALREAERRIYEYASACDVGVERTKAFVLLGQAKANFIAIN